MKPTKLLTSLTVVIFFLVSVIWVAVAQDAKNTQKSKHPEGSWDQVNRAARNIKNGDRRTAQALVDQVFLANGLDAHISASASSIKERLVSAETDFHNGIGEGIDTENIVASVNQLVERLKLPPYAATNTGEVKKIRLRMLTLCPDLVGRGSASKQNNSRPSFVEKMSPVEAFHIASTLIQQKVFNPEFQLTPAEREQLSRQEKATRPAKMAAVPNPGAPNDQRFAEMVTAIREAGKTMSFRDMLDQSEQSLDLLGIRR